MYLKSWLSLYQLQNTSWKRFPRPCILQFRFLGTLLPLNSYFRTSAINCRWWSSTLLLNLLMICFFLRWLWTFNVIAWNWTISGKHARWGQGAERIDSAHKYTVCHVFFNLPLILRIQSHFEGKRTNSPIVQIRRTDNPARRRRDRGKKNLLYLLRVPFNQLSYFFTVVNVFFCYSPFLSISLSLSPYSV